MTNQYSTDALRSLLDILGGQSEYRGVVLDFLNYVDLTVPPQQLADEPAAPQELKCPECGCTSWECNACANLLRSDELLAANRVAAPASPRPVVYFPCEKHMGQQFTMTVGPGAAPIVRCPGCEQPGSGPGEVVRAPNRGGE